jgi:hypothetical protein
MRSMDELKLQMAKEAEAYLADARTYLETLSRQVINCKDPVEKKKLQNTLESDQIRFSQLYKDFVIFKAMHGIYTPPKAHKRLD